MSHHPQPPTAYVPPPRKKTGRTIAITGGTIVAAVVLIGIGAAAGGSDDTANPQPTVTVTVTTNSKEDVKQPADDKPANDNGSHKAEDDVKITACEVDSVVSAPSADLTITNHSSKTSNYLIDVEFVDPSGTRLGSGVAAENNVATDQEVKTTAQGIKQVDGKVECRITKVSRYASS